MDREYVLIVIKQLRSDIRNQLAQIAEYWTVKIGH